MLRLVDNYLAQILVEPDLFRELSLRSEAEWRSRVEFLFFPVDVLRPERLGRNPGAAFALGMKRLQLARTTTRAERVTGHASFRLP